MSIGANSPRRRHARTLHGGVGRLAEISTGLIAAGKEPDTPVACGSGGTVPEQRTITGYARDIADRVAEAGLTAAGDHRVGDRSRPARGGLDWYERRLSSGAG